MQGLQSGAVLQRNRQNVCETVLLTDTDDTPVFSAGTVTKISANRYLFSGLPTGGPYTLDATADGRQYHFADLYVGDVWLLGGQSNMEGVGLVTPSDEELKAHTDPRVRVFFMNGIWGEAVPIVHTMWNCTDPLIADLYRRERDGSIWHQYDVPGEMPFHEDRRGVGPGFGFVTKMADITGVPQAVIPCAIGGSSILDWDPAVTDRDTFYAFLTRRLAAAGGRVRGLYWDQGESDTGADRRAEYVRRMQRLIASLRAAVGDPELPVVLDQIAATTLPWMTDKDIHLDWTAMRELQRRMPEYIGHCDVVPTLDAGMSDLIHKDSPSQHRIGSCAALSMAHLCGMGGAPSVTFRGFHLYPNEFAPFRTDLQIVYDHVAGDLTSSGNAMGVSIQLAGEDAPVFWPGIHIRNLALDGNVVTVHTELKREELENAVIYYGLGLNSVCTVRDALGRGLPAMGPVAVKDHLLK